MPLATRDVRRALLGKLECEEDVKRSHIFYYFFEDGKRVLSTHVSHGSQRDIPNALVAKMARQLQVNRGFFEEIVSCARSREDFVAKLRSDGFFD